ncbi:MAG TPA: TRAP transporter substrate-binding protein DctP [Stellaceae bacterium]|nr:TRAP transporter substrate-binding protein DctP [Stellaceae bacterium]
MKVRWFAALTIVMIVALSVTALPAAAQVKLLFTSMGPAGSTFGLFFNAWAKRVNDAAQGSGVVEVRDGTMLANFSNVYERVLDDVVQIGFGQQAFIGGKFPLTEVVGLPFVVKDNMIGSIALWRLYKSGLLDHEYSDIVPLWLNLLGPTYLHLTKAPRTLDNLDGLKIRVTGKVNALMVQRLGGAPISLSAEDMYDGLQRGTIDGAITSWSAFQPFHLADVAFYHVVAPLGTAPAMFFMARKKYDALPTPLRAALDANSGEAQSRAAGEAWKQEGLAAQAAVAANAKHKVVDLPPTQSAAWQIQTKPVIDQWAARVPNGQKVLDTYRALYAAVGAGR